MSETSESLASILSEVVKAERAACGPHPSAEVLAAYQSRHVVAGRRAEKIREHLVLCEECRALLLELAEFQEPSGATRIGEEELAAARALVWRRASAEEPAAPQMRRRWRLAAAHSWWALATAVLLLACLGLSIRLAQLQHRAEVYLWPRTNVLVEDLYPIDNPIRGGAEPPALAPTADVEQVTLIFHLGNRAGELPWEATILTADGRELWRGGALHPSPEGTTSLGLDRRFLPAGSYRIFLASPGSEQPLEFRFEIRYP